MMEEFALCWNKLKFAENLSTGFQSLYDRGDFVDCTIAVDGQLLQCHKLVLAICSPYFREIFMSNPCRHPISKFKTVPCSCYRKNLAIFIFFIIDKKFSSVLDNLKKK